MLFGIDLKTIAHVSLGSVLLGINVSVKVFHLIISVIVVHISLIHCGNMEYVSARMDTLNIEVNVYQILKKETINIQIVALGHILTPRKRNVSLAQMVVSVVRIDILVNHATLTSEWTLLPNYVKKTVEMKKDLFQSVMMVTTLMEMVVQLIVKYSQDIPVEVVVLVLQMVVYFISQKKQL